MNPNACFRMTVVYKGALDIHIDKKIGIAAGKPWDSAAFDVAKNTRDIQFTFPTLAITQQAKSRIEFLPYDLAVYLDYNT